MGLKSKFFYIILKTIQTRWRQHYDYTGG